MKEKSGIKTLEARIATKEGKFNVVPLTEKTKNSNSQSSTDNSKRHKQHAKKNVQKNV